MPAPAPETAPGIAPRWFLDTNVLFPRLLREILLGAAGAGLIRPYWSPRVLEEWRIAAARAGGMAAEADTRAMIADLFARHPDAAVDPDPATEAMIELPDRHDAHVAAAAAAAGADALVTMNLRDFPARRLAPFGLVARHPDSALWELWSHDPEALAAPIRAALATLDRREGGSDRGALRRAGLPRLGKAWEAA